MLPVSGKRERRKAKRININLEINVRKCSPSGKAAERVEWEDIARLKNISFLGAYFHYAGANPLNTGDVIWMDMVVPVPIDNTIDNATDNATDNAKASESIPLTGFATITRVHVHEENHQKRSGVGVQFLEPLSSDLTHWRTVRHYP